MEVSREGSLFLRLQKEPDFVFHLKDLFHNVPFRLPGSHYQITAGRQTHHVMIHASTNLFE